MEKNSSSNSNSPKKLSLHVLHTQTLFFILSSSHPSLSVPLLSSLSVPLLPSLSAPLLVLSGGYDLNVPPEETQAWATLLGTNDVIDHKTDVLPCITHSLVCVTEPQIGLVEEDDVGTTVDAQVIDELVIFLDSVTAS